MFGLFRRKQQDNSVAIINELQHVHKLISNLNIPVIADDVDAGYDMAIDEVLDVIDERITFYKNPTLDTDPTTDNMETA